MKNALTIIQASSLSTRLPNKIALEIAGKSILQHIYDAAPEPKLVTVPANDATAKRICDQIGAKWVTGPFKDLISAYLIAADKHKGWILRMTADCPMLTPELVNKFLSHTRMLHKAYPFSDWTILSNRPWDPDGYDLEAFSVEGLRLADKYATDAHDREHLCPWMYRHFIVERYSLLGRPCGPELPEEKVSVDTPEDYERVKALMEAH